MGTVRSVQPVYHKQQGCANCGKKGENYLERLKRCCDMYKPVLYWRRSTCKLFVYTLNPETPNALQNAQTCFVVQAKRFC